MVRRKTEYRLIQSAAASESMTEQRKSGKKRLEPELHWYCETDKTVQEQGVEKKPGNRRTEYYKKSADCAGGHKAALFCVIFVPYL